MVNENSTYGSGNRAPVNFTDAINIHIEDLHLEISTVLKDLNDVILLPPIIVQK